MRIFYENSDKFDEIFNGFVNRSGLDMQRVMPVVSEILGEVREFGDEAIYRHILKFDKWEANGKLEISQDEMKKSYENLDKELKDSLNLAYKRIESYHKKQLQNSWFSTESNGTILGQKVTPVDRAGLYIPGGKAAYPSSLLMNALPAIVAGVGEIVVCTPAVNGEVNSLLLAAMHICGIKKAYKIGGASAIGAMAYGTKIVPKVDVITGPGNIYVATAKKLVYGDVGIDMIAGPSEIGIIADDSANPNHIALDLLSQAEHDELASSFLVTCSNKFANLVKDEIEKILPNLERKEIALKSIKEKSAIFVAKSKQSSIELTNALAVEHLEIATDDAFLYLPHIKHAGAIFLGHYTPEAIGDYLAGPNHTLPTGGTARFYSPLSVENFMKKSSVICVSKEAINNLSLACASLADAEGLQAHKLSVLSRVEI